MSALKQGLGAVFAAASVLAVSPAVLAQPYPSKPIRVIVNSAPAGLTDVIARLVTPRMSQSMGQPMVVENRTGAGGLTGAEFVAKAEPDGYTIGVVASAVTVAPQLVATAPFDASKDFAPVALLMSTPLILVTGINSPYHSVAQLVADAKARPGQISIASGGHATMTHSMAEQFQAQSRTEPHPCAVQGRRPGFERCSCGTRSGLLRHPEHQRRSWSRKTSCARSRSSRPSVRRRCRRC